MDIMEKDPAYIAARVKFIRKMLGLTQENLADAAGLTTRTIEKIESGRHTPEEQTLRSIARAFGFDVKIFVKPTPEQEAREKAEMERALRKTVLVPTTPIHTASDFLAAFDQRDAFRFDSSVVTHDEALELVATIQDWIADLNDVWVECSGSQRLEYARNFAGLCRQLEEVGYLCHVGRHAQQARQKDRPTLVFDVGLLVILPKETGEGVHYAIVQLDGAWETLESARAPF